MSLPCLGAGKGTRGRVKRSGGISYAQLGINQPGTVYEALLAYREGAGP